MKIEVYKCRFSGTIFSLDQKEKYIKHLKTLRKEMKAARETDRLIAEADNWLFAEKEKIESIDEIEPWIIANQKKLMKLYNAVNKDNGFHDKFKPKDEFLSIKFIQMQYDSNTSNSHSCPKGGVTNWCARDKSLPTGYPGFHGNVSTALKRLPKNDWEYPTSSFLQWLGIHTGTGGGGNSHAGWDCEIFLADWPGISRAVLADTLSGVKK